MYSSLYSLLALQLMPIIVLLVERRRRRKSQDRLAERLRFELLLAQIAAAFSIAEDQDVDVPITNCLRDVCNFFSVNLAGIWQFEQESGVLHRTHGWPEDAAGRLAITPEHFPGTFQCMARGEVVLFADEVERNNLKDSDAFREVGIKSFLAIPLHSDQAIIRILTLVGVSTNTSWPSDIVTRLCTIADILGHVLARQRAAKTLRESELLSSQKLAEFERQKIKEEVAQMNRAAEMGQLAASLAHELAQPLAAVLSNAQAASRLAMSKPLDLDEIKSALADIIEDDQRACAVLNNMRSILGKHTVAPHEVNLNEIVEDAILLVRSSALMRGIHLEAVLSPKPVLVQGDEIPLQQVLLNLIINAMDAMAQSSGETKVLTVRTSVQNGDARGLLVVEDEGTGIPEELRARLFTPFFTTKKEGLGMGLAICCTILTNLGGTIDFQNRPERGTAFRVALPLALGDRATSESCDCPVWVTNEMR